MASNDGEKKKTGDVGADEVEIHTSPEVPWYRQLLAIKETLIIVLTPILFLPIFFASTTRVSIIAPVQRGLV